MMTKMNLSGIRGLKILKAAPLALLLLQGTQVLAQASSPPSKPQDTGFSVFEIAGSIIMIIVLILLAWFIGSRESKTGVIDTPHRPHRHFEHPNDPHFRKLKKKTS